MIRTRLLTHGWLIPAVAKPVVKPRALVTELIYTCPDGMRAIVRDISLYSETRPAGSFIGIRAEGNSGSFPGGAYIYATRSTVATFDHYTCDAVLDAGWKLWLDFTTPDLTWHISGAELPISAG